MSNCVIKIAIKNERKKVCLNNLLWVGDISQSKLDSKKIIKYYKQEILKKYIINVFIYWLCVNIDVM